MREGRSIPVLYPYLRRSCTKANRRASLPHPCTGVGLTLREGRNISVLPLNLCRTHKKGEGETSPRYPSCLRRICALLLGFGLHHPPCHPNVSPCHPPCPHIPPPQSQQFQQSLQREEPQYLLGILPPRAAVGEQGGPQEGVPITGCRGGWGIPLSLLVSPGDEVGEVGMRDEAQCEVIVGVPAGHFGPGQFGPGGSCRSSRSWPPLHVLTALVTPAGRCAPGGSYGRCGPGGSSCWSVFLEVLSGRCGPCLSEASRRLCAHVGAGHEEEEEGGRAEQRGCGTGAGSSQHPQKRQTDRQTDESRRRLS